MRTIFSTSFQQVEQECSFLESTMQQLIHKVGPIPIASQKIMPLGWRKAAKGRTVWRIVEEIISQNLEVHATELGFTHVESAESEVGVYDFKFSYGTSQTAYVNIKSAVYGRHKGKDDISKAVKLLDFYKENPTANLYIATFFLEFRKDLSIQFCGCSVFPIAWIPDIYVNPSNNGNLQSAAYQDLQTAVRRSNSDFTKALTDAINTAQRKKKQKLL